MGSKGEPWSLDLVVRVPGSTTTVSMHGRERPGSDVELVGTVTDDEFPGSPQAAVIRLTSRDLDRLQVEHTDNELIFFAGGERARTRIVDFSATPILGGRYEVLSGLVNKGPVGEADFIAVTDPVPIVILGGGILAAACMAFTGFAYVLQKVESWSSGFADACRKSGGIPVATVEIGLSFSLRKRDIGCKVTPRLECKRLDGTVISTQRGKAGRIV